MFRVDELVDDEKEWPVFGGAFGIKQPGKAVGLKEGEGAFEEKLIGAFLGIVVSAKSVPLPWSRQIHTIS